MVILFLFSCISRFPPDGSSADGPLSAIGELNFGTVVEGTYGSRTLVVSGTYRWDAVVSVSDALSWRWVDPDPEGTRLLVVDCAPDQLSGTTGTLEVQAADEKLSVNWSCQAGARTATLPSPLLTEIETEAVIQKTETGLGNAELGPEDGAELFVSPKTGDTFLTDPVKGRVWRQNALYDVPTWGVWAPATDTYAAWEISPECFPSFAWQLQTGTCTGTERNPDGSIPEGWSYQHGGFIDGGGTLTGVQTGIALPDADLLLLFGADSGAPFAAVVDASLDDRLTDESTYSYLQLTRPVTGALPDDLILGPDAEGAFGVDPASGQVYRFFDFQTAEPKVEATTSFDGPVGAWGHGPDALYVWVAGSLISLSAAGVEVLPDAPGWGSLGEAAPTLMAGDGTRIWAWYEGLQLLAWRNVDGSAAGVLNGAPIGEIQALAVDQIGKDSTDVGFAYFLVPGDAGVELRGAQAGANLVESAGMALPGTPLDLVVDPAPDDVTVAFAAGIDGCDGEFAAYCTDGSHPTLLRSWYHPYGLVAATETGHKLNLFLSPVLETPKDPQVDTDFADPYADCGPVPDGVDQGRFDGCCALAWAVSDRVQPNLDYFMNNLATLGDGTTATEDDPAVVLGINPSVFRQARLCYETANYGPAREAGYSLFAALAEWRDQGLQFTNWTHTGVVEEGTEADQLYFIDLLYPGMFDAPLDSQAEFEMLHDGMAAIFDYDALGSFTTETGTVEMSSLELPFLASSGCQFDGPVMIGGDRGWPDDDPSWVRAVRDAPMALGGDPVPLFYFAGAGGIPAVGIETYRKKELYPIDVRRRAAMYEMGEGPDDWYLEGTSGMAYMPGVTWELGTVGSVSRAGVFRETLRYGTTVEPDDWKALLLYIRRILASAEPEDVKTWYIHIYDISTRDGDFQANSGVTEESDINQDAIEWLNTTLVTPGYARWSTPDEILAEWESR